MHADNFQLLILPTASLHSNSAKTCFLQVLEAGDNQSGVGPRLDSAPSRLANSSATHRLQDLLRSPVRIPVQEAVAGRQRGRQIGRQKLGCCLTKPRCLPASSSSCSSQLHLKLLPMMSRSEETHLAVLVVFTQIMLVVSQILIFNTQI